jgi:nucleotide-binding universal stress UspA family protein
VTDRRRRIVVGVDGSEGSKDALRWAKREAELTSASLDVIMTWEVPVVPYGVWAGYDASTTTETILKETVAEVVGGDNSTDVVLTAVEGRPVPVLLNAAKKADLLVVGSRGHGPLTAFLLGSVSLQCVSHAPCPVVVVPHRPIESESPESVT